MIPIEKNIVVVDEQGNFYESTYPRRAKGLVKNGRARFIDENTICLVSLPNENVEDNLMSDNVINDFNKEIKETVVSAELIMSQIFEQIKMITSQTEHLNNAFQMLGSIPNGECGGPGSPGDIAGKAKAESLASMVRDREATNQQTLKLLEKMYDDLKPENTNEIEIVSKKFKREVIDKIIDTYDIGDCETILKELIHDL